MAQNPQSNPPASARNLSRQQPNSSMPIAQFDMDPTGLFDSLGKPISGKAKISGDITPSWRYQLGQLGQPIVTTVANLPDPTTVQGNRSYSVTDCISPAAGSFGFEAVGGGKNFVPVHSDGTKWIIG